MPNRAGVSYLNAGSFMIDLDHISYWYPRRTEAALRDVTVHAEIATTGAAALRAIEAREIEIDDLPHPGRLTIRLGRSRLQEAARQVARLAEQE